MECLTKLTHKKVIFLVAGQLSEKISKAQGLIGFGSYLDFARGGYEFRNFCDNFEVGLGIR